MAKEHLLSNAAEGAGYIMPKLWVYKDILERTGARIISPD